MTLGCDHVAQPAADPNLGLVPRASKDRLLGGRIRLCQPERGYRVAIDPVLLAAAAPVSAGQRALDLGCGVGAAALCLLCRVPDCDLVGLEIQPELARLARANAAVNSFDARLTIVRADIAQGSPFHAGVFDHILCNPPHHLRERGRAADDPSRAQANQEHGADLPDWLDLARRAARPGGFLTLIHRADRLDDVVAALTKPRSEAKHRFGGVTVFPLWPKAGRPAKRILVQARLGSRAPARLCAGLVLHQDNGDLSQEAQAVLRGASALPL